MSPSSLVPTAWTPLQGRLVHKHGGYNVYCTTQRACDIGRLVADLFTTLVEMRWRFICLLFVAVFTVSWLLFGFAWWGVVVAHGDHLHENDTDWKPCLSNVYSLPDALLFSIDLQSTMGYGFGEIETACPGAIGFFMLQSVVGVFIECVATGIVFSKLIRPKRRFRTIMFSEKAVVNRQPDGQMALQFRVGDMRKKCLIAATVSAVVIKTDWTNEGEQLPLCQHALELRTETDDDATFLIWPETITHVLNEASPLAELTKNELNGDGFEIIVLLEGTDDTTGMATQLRTSYLPSEILWGYRLMPLSIRPQSNGNCSVDYSQFNAVLKDEDSFHQNNNCNNNNEIAF
jgi:potassium inwardly-rectifying channel subfamily J